MTVRTTERPTWHNFIKFHYYHPTYTTLLVQLYCRYFTPRHSRARDWVSLIDGIDVILSWEGARYNF